MFTIFQIKKALLLALIFMPIMAGFLLSLLVFSQYSTSSTMEVKGVVLETARDVNGTAQAPVSYEFQGTAYTDFVEGDFIKGESVTVPVSNSGEYVSGSVFSNILVIIMLPILGVSMSFLLHAVLHAVNEKLMIRNGLGTFMVPKFYKSPYIH